MAVDLVRQVPALHQADAIRQGATAKVTLILLDASSNPQILTGHTLFAEIRDQAFDDATRGPVIANWVVDNSDAANGTFVLTLTKESTAGLAAGDYLWDALLQAPDLTIEHLAPNTVTVVPGVTAPPV